MKKVNSPSNLGKYLYYCLLHCLLFFCTAIPTLALAWGSCAGNSVSLTNAFNNTANYSGINGNMTSTNSTNSGTISDHETIPLGQMASGCANNPCSVTIGSITVGDCTYTNFTVNMESGFGTCKITDMTAGTNKNSCRYKISTTDIGIEIYEQE